MHAAFCYNISWQPRYSLLYMCVCTFRDTISLFIADKFRNDNNDDDDDDDDDNDNSEILWL